jgi:regulator of replication initiation timing
VSLHSAENLPAIKSDLQNQREVMQAVVAENQRMRVEMEDMREFVRAVQQSGLLNRG